MRAKIEITGQPHGNFILLHALKTYMYDANVVKRFNDYVIEYKSKKDALHSLKRAIKMLNSEREPCEKRYGHIGSLTLCYDASFAKIL